MFLAKMNKIHSYGESNAWMNTSLVFGASDIQENPSIGVLRSAMTEFTMMYLGREHPILLWMQFGVNSNCFKIKNEPPTSPV